MSEALTGLASHKDQRSTSGKEKTKMLGEASEETNTPEASEAPREEQSATPTTPIADPMENELELLRKSLQEEKDRAEQYLVSLKYLKAEFENYQKRSAKEMDELAKRGSERLARKLLGIVDDIERTINACKAVGDQSKLLAGVEMILKELVNTLRSEGIFKIEAVGKRFDPQLHEAIMVKKTDECPPGTVVEELRAGYMFDGRVIRPSMVTVANPPDRQGSPEPENKVKGGGGQRTSSGVDKRPLHET